MYRAITRIVLLASIMTAQVSLGIIAATGIAALPAQAVPQQTVQARRVLALDPDGLRIFNAATGSARAIPFGLKANVVSILTRLRGKPRVQSINEECGLGFAQWSDGLTLQFREEKFVGWFLNDRNAESRNLATSAGIGIGSTLTDLQEAYTIEVSQTTLGTEFAAGELWGLLSGSQPTDKVTSLSSGATCTFR
jgi:hypothetical protein